MSARAPQVPRVEATGQRTLVLHAGDDLAVALHDLAAHETVEAGGARLVLPQGVPAKHKFTTRDIPAGGLVRMYGVTVGRAVTALPAGTLVTTANLVHAVDPGKATWSPPAPWPRPTLPPGLPVTFDGYHRGDGGVGVANVWLVVPLVFCENRNVDLLQAHLERQLGFVPDAAERFDLRALAAGVAGGADGRALDAIPILGRAAGSGPAAADAEHGAQLTRSPYFPNVDGVRFLRHEGGCGGTRGDSARLVRLLAGYLLHPNVGGATVLSLGCQNAQVAELLAVLAERGAPASLAAAGPGVTAGIYGPTSPGEPTGSGAPAPRRIVVAEQQAAGNEAQFLGDTLRQTVIGIGHVNRVTRAPAPVSALCLGLECGGSDGFSGITANPLLGTVSDWLVAAGGRSILAEFPELNGVEGELIGRCERAEDAERFARLMSTYAAAAERAGSGFAYNPSPGNIREGLITDAMKSAGAARKGGTAPISGVLDYTEPARRPGLHLLCTPGNDVESTTGLAGSGAQIIAFTTGLGTPTGNPVAPVLKVSSNSEIATRLADLVDFDAGELLGGRRNAEELAAAFWRKLIATASGTYATKAERLRQFDFIPWRQDLSL